MTIVTRQMAESAARLLGLEETSYGAAEVQTAYRSLAKHCHPDKGGCMDDFVKLDRAKCVLLAWLARPRPEPADLSISSTKCLMCGGSGRRTLRRGFQTMTMVCGTCRGTGELTKPEKVEE